VLFQVHLWSGIGVGLYVLMISVTGSVLVYRNELYRAATPEPVMTRGSGPLLTDIQLTEAARRLYPDYEVVDLRRPRNPDQAVDVWLRRGGRTRVRLIDPRTGGDLGDAVPLAMRTVSGMLDLHDNLLAGETGRRVNGLGALAVLVLALSGLAIWWPGVRTWRRSVTLPRRVGWQRATWHLHSMIGFWTLAFTLVFGASGLYLAFPDWFQVIAERLEPRADTDVRARLSEEVLYWLAYLHFGRINGIGIPCSGPGVCDQATKAVWAIFGAAPALMFVTGAMMWWNRVVRSR
jgi:uncharacterized iron-regulated membrane protein